MVESPANRIIVHIDLDAFYAQYEQIQNPTLAHLPLGIKQKHIIVTSNYEARRRGVGKLASVSEALKRVPDLVIVDGEDITRYRRSSRTIFELIKRLLNGEETADGCSELAGLVNVERLGFDEYFADVTGIVDRFLETYTDELHGDGRWFELPYLMDKDGRTFTGFRFSSKMTFPGHTLPSVPMQQNTLHTKMLLGSHIAKYLRDTLKSVLGYTSGAGIASNKVLAKLAGGIHKPNDQTALFPEAIDEFMRSVPLRSVAGLGYRTRKIIQEKLDSSLVGKNDNEFSKAIFMSDMKVGYVRSKVSPEMWISWLGEKAPPYDLLFGKDDSEVVMTGLATQISVEDSFPSCQSIDEARSLLLPIAVGFLERFQEDEYVDSAQLEFLHPSMKQSQENSPRWRRYAKQLRFTMRQRVSKNYADNKRESKTLSMPIYVYDLGLTIDARAKKLVDGLLIPTLSKMVSKRINWCLTLFNIAAVGFTTQKSNSNIETFFKPASPSKSTNAAAVHMTNGDTIHFGDENELDDGGEMSYSTIDCDMNGDMFLCPTCHVQLPRFCQEAHQRYHEMGE